MIENTCPNCGASNPPGSHQCRYCGTFLRSHQDEADIPPEGSVVTNERTIPHDNYSVQYTVYNFSNDSDYQSTPGYNILWPVRSRYIAALLAILLGGFGLHKFYLRQYGWGFLYLLFCWTGIPEIIGFIEGIIYLLTNTYDFQRKYHVRSM